MYDKDLECKLSETDPRQGFPRGTMLWTDENAWTDGFEPNEISQMGVSSFSGKWGDPSLEGKFFCRGREGGRKG